MAMPGGYAACAKHAEDAVNWASGRKLPIRISIVEKDPLYLCHCRRPAHYYLYEVSPDAPVEVVPPTDTRW